MISVLFILTFVFSSYADEPYFPCKSYISFNYDDSNTLANDGFKVQMNFIKSVIGTLNYPNRLRAEGGYTGEFNWNSGLSISQMQQNIDNAQQNPMPYSLSQQAASLLTSIEVLDNYNNDPIAALIFISDTSDSALRNADRWFAKLSGIDITFVLMGVNVDSSKLMEFSTNFLYWADLSQPQPDHWENSCFAAFGCTNGPIKPTTPSSLSTVEPYYPCKSWISFGIDDSDTMNYANFSAQIEFMKSEIGSLNYPSRLQVSTVYDGVPVPWNNFYGIASIQQILTDLCQYSGFNLRTQFSNLVSKLINLDPSNMPITAVIFVSDTSDSALVGADHYISFLSDVRITFVMLGTNVEASKLLNFSNNFIFWPDLSTPKPLKWDSLRSYTYGCDIIPSPTPPPWTGSPQPSTMAPFVPCKSWISFGVDDSFVLNLNDFFTQLNFISKIVGTLNHPERLQITGAGGIEVPWENSDTIQTIQKTVLDITQFGEYNLGAQFRNLVFVLQSFNPFPDSIAAIIFISDTSDFALLGADQYMASLKDVRITFVLLGPNADSTKLTKFSTNFVHWTDLSQQMPSDWVSSSYSAYGCQ